MRKIKTYTAYNPPVETLEDNIDLTVYLSLEVLEDEHGNILESRDYNMEEQLVNCSVFVYDDHKNILETRIYDSEEQLMNRNVNAYNENGKIIRSEEFLDGETESNIITCYEYDPNGFLMSETATYWGEVTKKIIRKYNSSGKLIEKTEYKPEQDEQKIFYEYHLTKPDLCVREEHFSGTENIKNISREWKLNDEKPFLQEEFHEVLNEKYMSRIYRFYDPQTTEGKVWREVYNDLGDLLEDYKLLFSKGNEVFSALAQSEDGTSSFSVEHRQFDSEGREIVCYSVYDNASESRVETRYNSEGLPALQLIKRNRYGNVEIFLHKIEYENIS